VTETLWGSRRRRHIDDRVIVDELHVRKGGYSSLHEHRHQDHVFQVLSGLLVIEQQFGRGRKSVAVGCGELATVHGSDSHRFAARAASVVIEVSLAHPGHVIDPQDIIRHDEGGCKDG
jgi:mannose-6-phosphate isomerase-like protein (cupin superfamily)